MCKKYDECDLPLKHNMDRIGETETPSKSVSRGLQTLIKEIRQFNDGGFAMSIGKIKAQV